MLERGCIFAASFFSSPLLTMMLMIYFNKFDEMPDHVLTFFILRSVGV